MSPQKCNGVTTLKLPSKNQRVTRVRVNEGINCLQRKVVGILQQNQLFVSVDFVFSLSLPPTFMKLGVTLAFFLLLFLFKQAFKVH